MESYPQLKHTALDATDVRGLAEFWRELLGLAYRPGDEPRPDEAGVDWLVLLDAHGRRVLAVNRVARLDRPTWPEGEEVPKQLHLDLAVSDRAELDRQRRRAEDLGATLLLDRTDDEAEPLYALSDPAGHPFCLLVSDG